jgi:hypothetical protein
MNCTSAEKNKCGVQEFHKLIGGEEKMTIFILEVKASACN